MWHILTGAGPTGGQCKWKGCRQSADPVSVGYLGSKACQSRQGGGPRHWLWDQGCNWSSSGNGATGGRGGSARKGRPFMALDRRLCHCPPMRSKCNELSALTCGTVLQRLVLKWLLKVESTGSDRQDRSRWALSGTCSRGGNQTFGKSGSSCVGNQPGHDAPVRLRARRNSVSCFRAEGNPN